MSDKIEPGHCKRAAYVYVRQSKMHQVREHRESNRRQYDLAKRAHALGFSEVVVIDDDLGRSGTGSQERPGFGRLLAAVCEGRVGAVLALEASRLARNNRDWHHLVDLCALAGTLVIDDDGVYDPRQFNDRLLLGLKGSMAEFELGLMRQRAQESLRQMIARGEVLWEVAVGYVRTDDNRMEMTPDEQIRAAMQGVFAKFRELGSARQVLMWYRQEKIPLPSQRRRGGGIEVTWQLPTYKRIHAILTNPTYAGAFFHGRTRTRVSVRDGRPRKSAGHRVPIGEWPVLIRDHHAAYISWDEYQRNRQRLEENLPGHHQHSRGAPRKGSALLAGLLRCAQCGRRLTVAYGGLRQRVARYICRSGHLHGVAQCRSFGGLRVDEAVAECVLSAIQPAGVQAALLAAEQLGDCDEEKRRALELALEKARYEAERARRQYDAVEPENRLIARELEARWEQALKEVSELETRLQAIPSQCALNADMRQRLLALGQDLRRVWHHPQASIVLKKRILRTVLEEIVAEVRPDNSATLLRLHWRGGVHTELVVPRNRMGHHRRTTSKDVLEVIRELAKICDDRSIASILNRLGYKTGCGNTWIASRVASLRSRCEIPALHQTPRQWLTLRDAAQELGLHHTVVQRLIEQQILPAKQVVPLAPWVIERSSLQLREVEAAVAAMRSGRVAHRRDPRQQELALD